MSKGYIYLIVLTVWLGSIIGVGIWQNRTGHAVEKLAWETKQSAELTVANKMITDLETKARTSEQDHATAINTIDTNYQRSLTNANTKYAHDIAAIRAGTIKLRDPAASKCANSGTVSGTPANTSGSDGGEGTGLSETTSEFLLTFAHDADEVVNQLQSCQAVLKADRAL